MNQLELNKKVAEAYGVDAERKLILKNYEGILLHQDTLTLFRLCIEHGFTVETQPEYVTCYIMYKYIDNCSEQYKDHSTKEAATCAAMFAALAKLKGIE